ncbi:uncharacterized protein [Venturia canescens]|uniref:uncharacterized protein n=1 Tax=Venturia canescens TaxID=32260 RepID=UPI001C9CF119|nr:uncharacterized protein LOC122413909 [Venturia canescens]
MTDKEDNFAWARRLGCPTSALTSPIRKSLEQGISSLLWDELSGVSLPAEDVLKIRKNILLYKLTHREKDEPIQHIQNIAKLKAARSLLDPQIENLEKKCKKQDFVVRQKQQQLHKIKSQRHLLKTREDLLRMKLNQTKKQVEDCEKVRSICRHLNPADNCQIDPNIVDESLTLVSTISTKADEKMVFNKLSTNLNKISISALWNVLLSGRIRDTEKLIELSTGEINEGTVNSASNLDILISKSRGEYITAVIQEHIHRTKTAEHEKALIEYIEKIEALDAKSSSLRKWLALSLEVRQLETKKKCLEDEVDDLKKTLEERFRLEDELKNLDTEKHNINSEMEQCIKDIQKSFVLLKPAGSEIMKIRDQMQAVLQEIVALREEEQNMSFLNEDSSTELHIFHDTIQLEALGKIVLKNKVGAYKHRKFCTSAALETMAPLHADYISQFPMIQAPVYQLLNCYKLLVTASWLTKLEGEANTNERYDLGEWISPIAQDSPDDTIEILNVTDLTCHRVREEIAHFDSIFDAWKYQSVRKLMALDDRTVNGASYKEWIKRYELMLHMLRKLK